MIRPCELHDAASICEIYNPYVRDTTCTFEEDAVSEETMRARVRETTRVGAWLVHQEAQRISGFAYAKPWHARSAYRYTVEATIYLDREIVGRGHGRELYAALIAELGRRRFHRVVGVIALPNEPSVRLHEHLGFEKAGLLPQVGRKLDRWIDVGYWVRALAPALEPPASDPP